ncbi:glycosyltransferase family 2 protein [Acetobacterium bakii]|uniref:Bactoprenol glucosyl transferase n=1 Tax=Acetobacterium bakii TaxID=52689 RepID=A0A0L6TV84_9FIRM|nr:glycosyltransferase family 2 protein [Acetobacterium bakii]KNZ40173.1 bactoprenol glucosyl transferase [Acetobacterium bakii]
METETISIVIPCYCEEEVIPIFYNTLIQEAVSQLSEVNFEILFIDDGSKDDTLKIIKNLGITDSRVKYVSFSRNFGKEAAIYAGLKHATGDYVAIMDVDLQDPPELLIPMYEAIMTEGYDCVATRRETRIGEPSIRSFFARRFYKLINKISQMEIMEGARDFRLMKRSVVAAVLEVGEYNRFSKGIFEWVGFNTKWIPYTNAERVAGETKWSFWELFLYSMEGIIAFSTAPLAIASVTGLIFCILSFLAIVVIIIREILWHGSAFGWPSLVCIIFFIGGIQLFCTGILGQYLARTYLETKKRPIYIVKEHN